MRTASILAFGCFLIVCAYYFFGRKEITIPEDQTTALNQEPRADEEQTSLLSQKRKKELDQIGAVINERTVKIDKKKKEEIKVAKTKFETEENLKDLTNILEQSFLDKNSTPKDIEKIQKRVVDLKKKLNKEVSNTEKWDPRFVYYLMIQEQYTYAEVNLIRSLADNGISEEEHEYIKSLIKEKAFADRIEHYKGQYEPGRSLASYSGKAKEKVYDDYTDEFNDSTVIEDKLIEMNYTDDERDEMIHGHSQH